MELSKLNQRVIIIVFLSGACLLLPFIALRLSPTIARPLSHSDITWRFGYRLSSGQIFGRTILDGEPRELEQILRRAAMPDRTVIITTLNQAWAAQNAMIDLFLESFRIGEGTSRFVNHLMIVALDQMAYDRCVLIHFHCFFLKTDGVDFSGEKYFMTDDYLKMMWRRIDFLREVLEEGYNFLFTDADIMWLRDPFPHFSPEADFQIACDYYNGYPKSLRNRPNGGFAFARSNKRSIEFYRYWYNSRELHPGRHDQDVLNKIKYDEALAEIGLRLMFLDTNYYSGFCEPTQDFEKVCTMHANCCLGLDSKLDDLRLVLADWRRYKSLTPQEKGLQSVSWSAPKACLLTMQN